MSTSWPALALEVVPERVGVVADVDGDDGVVRRERAEERRRRRGVHPAVRRRRGRPAVPSPLRHRVHCGRRRRSRRSGRSAGGSAAEQHARASGRCRPTAGTSTGWNLPSIMRSRSTWIVGTQVAMPVWFENDAPSTSRQSLRPSSAEPTGVPDRPSTPQASGWSSGTRPFALNVVMTGRRSARPARATWSRNGRAPLPTMIDGPLGRCEQRDRPVELESVAGRSPVVGDPAGRGRGSAGSRQPVAAPAPRRGRSGGRRRAARSRASSPAPPARWRSPGARTVWLHSATASNACASGTSWNAPGPMTWVCTWPVSASTGTRSTLASHRPVSRLVAPGPAIERHAAGRPVSLA